MIRCDRFLYYYIHLSAPTLPKPHYPSKIANTLGSLAKGELLLLSNAQPTIEGSSHQHRRKHFPYRQVVNIFVSVPVQLVKSNMVYTLCKHMVYMLSITNEHKNELENKLYVLPEELNTEIAALKLQAMGVGIDKLTQEQETYLHQA